MRAYHIYELDANRNRVREIGGPSLTPQHAVGVAKYQAKDHPDATFEIVDDRGHRFARVKGGEEV